MLYIILISIFTLSFRICSFLIPTYAFNLANFPFVNLFASLASDLTFIFSFAFLISIFESNLNYKKTLLALKLTLTFLFFFWLLSSVRYLEHFGMQIQLFQITSIKTSGLQSAVVGLLQESIFVKLFILFSIIFSILIYFFRKKILSIKLNYKLSFVFLGMITLFNSAYLNSANKEGIQPELVQNPIMSIGKKLINYKNELLLNLEKPNEENLKYIRESFLTSKRDWAKPNDVETPFLQSKVFSNPKSDNQIAIETFKKFHKHIQESQKSSNLNIIVVMLESGLSRYYDWQNEDKQPRHLTPNIDKFLKSSILFNKNFASGKQTKDGQIATYCSLYTVPNFYLMKMSPFLPSICLHDILITKNYETFFFHNADNNFDNKALFYKFHHTKYIFGEESFNPNIDKKGGWGFSDHAMFSKVLEKISTLHDSSKPFFVSALSLTNHHPFIVPKDIPDGIINDTLEIQLQVIQYVDWAFGQFISKVNEKYPNSLVVLLSDQGIFGTQENGIYPTQDSFVDTMRIPFAIYMSNLPNDLKGIKFNHITSDVDVTPTLLSLLDETNITQQFMGENAFLRTSAIYSAWFDSLFKISSVGENDLKFEKIDKEKMDLLNAIYVHGKLVKKF